MKLIIFVTLFVFIMPIVHSSYSEQADGSIRLVKQPDIAELMMQKYQLQVDQRNFTVFYRFSTLEGVGSGSEDYDVNVMSLAVNQKNFSLVFTVNNIKQADIMSIRFPEELISAEKGKFTILADGKQRGYEMSVQEESRNLIFVVPEHTSKVEIIGTRVIPEFPSAVLILVIVSSVLLVTQRFYKN
jgi:hypothetical protein